MIWENGKLLIFVLANIKLRNLNIDVVPFTISLYDVYVTLVETMWSIIEFLPYIGIYNRFRERASLYLEQTDKCCETKK